MLSAEASSGISVRHRATEKKFCEEDLIRKGKLRQALHQPRKKKSKTRRWKKK